jgi:hypothetical protein
MSVRLIVDGAVYMLAAREAMALVRRLRYRQLAPASPLEPATSAAVLLEWALAQERPPGITLTRDEAEEVVRLVGRRNRALARALRRRPR